MIAFLLVIVSLLALVGSAFCSGTETAFLSVSRERLLHLARVGGRKARIVQQALSDMARTMTTLLIGNNLMNVIYSSATAALSVRLLGDDAIGRTLAGFFAAFLVLYTSEFMPKLICSARPLRRSLLHAPAYRMMALALAPLTSIAMRLTNLFLPRRETKYRLTATDLVNILRDRKDGVCLSDVESTLITCLIRLRARGESIASDAFLDSLREME